VGVQDVAASSLVLERAKVEGRGEKVFVAPASSRRS